jgi:hypothetical protein
MSVATYTGVIARLVRAIQYAAASRPYRYCLWNNRPDKPGDDEGKVGGFADAASPTFSPIPWPCSP